MPQNSEESNPTSGKKPAEESGAAKNAGCAPGKSGADEFKSGEELDGKTDSGPEPDVHGREIPPQ